MDEQFNLEFQYLRYLSRVELKESAMHPVQRQETKRAFMGACAQMLVLMREELTKYSEDEAVDIIQAMWTQAGEYWNKQ